MQFFAYDQGKAIFSEAAIKGKDYRCPECQGRLRVKEGVHKRKHFFHLNPPLHCRQSKKSEAHLALQKTIATLLPAGDSHLEKRFPSIGRIADVVWESKHIIFEVQCSPISLHEVKSRMADYHSVGYKVTWILYDHRFNRRRLSAAENYLRPSHAFFATLSRHGEGLFYDQYELFSLHKRIQKGPPRYIDITNPPSKRPKPPPSKPRNWQKLKDLASFAYYLILKKGT